MSDAQPIRWFEEIGSGDVARVGGKNASLGEMIRHLGRQGVRVPRGFCTTADAYRRYLRHNDLDQLLRAQLRGLAAGERSLEDAGTTIRRAIRHAAFPPDVAEAIRRAYAQLCREEGAQDLAVAVRSSATAEDLPEASFAGQQDSYLNVRGADDLLEACRRCYASLFTNRAIHYRQERGFDHLQVALSIGIQRMVAADRACAGVMFTLDVDTGFPDVIVINAAWGLGETVVQGIVDPDEYRVFKPRLGVTGVVPIVAKNLGGKEKKIIYADNGKGSTKTVDTTAAERRRLVLDDDEIMTLARWAVAIEAHYGTPMDIEWAKDAASGELYCVQARPETVHSQRRGGTLESYRLVEQGEVLAEGVAIGEAIAAGRVRILHSPSEMRRFEDGDVLVTERTDPDWGPIMKRAAAIVTDRGGRTSHAAIVSRELGVPAVVGCGDASKVLRHGSHVTVSCAEGSKGKIFGGALRFEREQVDLEQLPEPPVALMINLATPEAAFRWWRLPTEGVGLARMEFIISDAIKIHPLALTRFEQIEDVAVREEIEELTAGYDDKTEYFVDRLARGIACIAASQYPHRAIVRLSDFKTNEYAQLIGGEMFEPKEENPMLGFRGASRYYSDRYRDGFALECRALRRAREVLGLDNVCVMVPFVRTVEEADRVIAALAEQGLRRGADGLELYMMCEIPSNVFLAEQFAARFDGFSIGSNDLTQLILGVDRDSGELRELFDERNEAVTKAIRDVIARVHRVGGKVGICGEAPSDYPEFARFLVDAGIDSISLNPASVLGALRKLTSRSDSRRPARRSPS